MDQIETPAPLPVEPIAEPVDTSALDLGYEVAFPFLAAPRPAMGS